MFRREGDYVEICRYWVLVLRFIIWGGGDGLGSVYQEGESGGCGIVIIR